MPTKSRTPYKLRRPCAKCPFRTDVPGYLRRERAIEIARSIAEGSEFPCHETTVTDEDEFGEEHLVPGSESQFCAGALICMEKQEAPNQQVRIAERLGVYEAERLDMDAPVHSSFVAFVDHHGEEESDTTCSVVNGNCEAPAGYMIGGSVIPGEGGDVHECPTCGDMVCDSCSDDDGVCDYCSEEE